MINILLFFTVMIMVIGCDDGHIQRDVTPPAAVSGAMAPAVDDSVKLVVSKRRNWLQDEDKSTWKREDTLKYLHTPWRGSIEGVVTGDVTFLGKNFDDAFVFITVTGITIEQAQRYIEPLYDIIDGDTVETKERRWFFSQFFIDSAKTLYKLGLPLTMTKNQARNVIRKFVFVSTDSVITEVGDNE